MKRRTTSHRIASMITRITLSVIGIFGLVINAIHFLSWYGVPDESIKQLVLDRESDVDEDVFYRTMDMGVALRGDESLQPTVLPLLKKEHIA